MSNTCENFNKSKNFKIDKTKTHNFFKNTKVNSCSHVFEFKNKCFAVPFKITNFKGNSLSAYKNNPPKSFVQKSVYRRDYSNKPFMHVGMIKKPLVSYDPDSYRNRLPTSDFYMPPSNLSRLDICNQNSINRKQWITTSKDSYQWPVKTLISNTGILSDNAKRSHHKFYSHC